MLDYAGGHDVTQHAKGTEEAGEVKSERERREDRRRGCSGGISSFVDGGGAGSQEMQQAPEAGKGRKPILPAAPRRSAALQTA